MIKWKQFKSNLSRFGKTNTTAETKKHESTSFTPDENIIENLVNRHQRPTKLYRKILPEVLKQIGVDSNAKVIWSQYAGCSCPCSPGFILQNYFGKSVYVTI